jgi:hypothetical protein
VHLPAVDPDPSAHETHSLTHGAPSRCRLRERPMACAPRP